MNLRFKNRWLSYVSKRVDLKDGIFVKIFIGVFLIVVVAQMFPRNESIEFTYQVGSVWTNDDLISPFSFPIYKDQRRYEKEKLEAISTVYPIVERRRDVELLQLESLKVMMTNLRAAVDGRRQWLKSRRVADSLLFRESLVRFSFGLSGRQWDLLGQWRMSELKKAGDAFSKFDQTLTTILTDILHVGVIDSQVSRQSRKQLAVRKGALEEIVEKDKLFDRNNASMEMRERLSASLSEPEIVELGSNILRIVLRPNIISDPAETQRLVQVAIESVPKTLGFVQENDRIVGKYDRIAEDVKLKLDSFLKAKAERGSQHDIWGQRLGILLHVVLILSLYGIYLFLFRKRIFHNNAMLTLIALLLVIETFFAYLSISLNVVVPIQYLIFVPATSMLLTIIFDSRVAFYGTVTMAFLVAGIRGNDYSIALASLVAGALGAYTVRDIRNRTQIFRSIGFIFLGYSVTILALSLERFESVETTLAELTFGLANAVFSPVLTYGLLIFFERVFHVATDLTLLELSDLNHPLLRQLSEKAPGTFHHSVTLGNLAEAAAEAIGANSILARVGAYYHDIGKIEKPEYFVENQPGSQSKHSKLRPRMSALVIISHVKEGIELARQHGLPENIVDFIPQHHGTNRISFFFDKALRLAAARKNPKDTVREEDFSYPGPKPQSKETAIVMLADLVEASTRTMEDVTPQKLEQAIDNLVKQRFVEGQLDECELTLKDLTKIKESFLKILIGIHHQRIQYPEQAEPAVAVQETRPEGAPPPVQADNSQVKIAGTPESPTGSATQAEVRQAEPSEAPPANSETANTQR